MDKVQKLTQKVLKDLTVSNRDVNESVRQVCAGQPKPVKKSVHAMVCVAISRLVGKIDTFSGD